MKNERQNKILEIAQAARDASGALGCKSAAERDEALRAMAAALRAHVAEIVEANGRDMDAAREAGTKESLLDSEVIESSLYGREPKKLREYAEDNVKLKRFRQANFDETRNGTAQFDHPKHVYDEFIKEDHLVGERE